MKPKISFPRRAITLRNNGALQVHHTPADILAAEVPIVRANPENQVFDRTVYEKNGMLCVSDLNSLPIDRCIKTNRPADTIVMIDFRNPLNPMNWWGKSPRSIMIGLSSTAHARYQAATVSAWVALFGALVAFVCGLFWGPIFFLFSLVLLTGAFFVKASRPVRLAQISREITAIKGASADYLRHVILQNNRRKM